jgi:hypothetical protein
MLAHETYSPIIPAHIINPERRRTNLQNQKHTTPMLKIFNAYASRKGVDVDALRLLCNGNRINPEDTPKLLELEDKDMIQVVLHQHGGMQCL